ncbi:MAG: TetR/AcrR family transcriptional regulator [Microthrixaceae bacterium]|nr:TetR/AcrR family transcriptional regulator [Microthrixaceae bacterium]
MPARTPVTTADETLEVASSENARVQRSRARIIEASIDLIVEDGAHALTVDAIAERSGVAKSTLYRHWRSIDDLVLDVFRAAVPPAVKADPSASFDDALHQMVATVAESLADPRYLRLLPDLLALRAQYPELGELADRDRAQKEAGLAAILAAGAAEGRVPADLDVRTVASVLLGPMTKCALFGETERIEAVGAFAVDRFIASYR